MSIESQRRSNGMSQESGIDYTVLREDALAEAPRRAAEMDPTKADYARSVADINRSYDYYRSQKVGLSEAIDGLHEIYCDDVKNQTHRQFNELIIETVPAFRNRKLIDQKNKVLDDAAINGQFVPDLKGERDKISSLIERVCEYDHALTDVIAAGRQIFNRGDIVNWIAATAGGTEDSKVFARQSVNGVVSELAVMDALSERPGEFFAAFSSVREDLKGVDIKVYDDVQSEKSFFTIDVKHSGSKTEPHWRKDKDGKGGHPHLIVRVDPGKVEGLHVDSNVRHEIRQQILEARAIAINQREALNDYVSPNRIANK